MRKSFVAAALAGLCLASTGFAFGQDARQRAGELAAYFNKSKHEVREKKGVRVEKFKEVRSELAVRPKASDYTGEYEADSEYPLSIRVGADGIVEGNGYEPAPPQGSRRFTLRGARVEGALLTGTKVYDDGSTEKFEGVFINRTDRNRVDDPGTTEFGLGVVFDPPKAGEGYELNKLFYRLK